MSVPRDKMIAALNEHLVRVLRARGFTGSFPHFRRLVNDRLHLLTVQFDKHGGGFVVEVASCSSDGVKTSWGTHVAPATATAQDVNHRLRLGAIDTSSDHWFRFDSKRWSFLGDPYAKAARAVLPFLDSQAETFWAQRTGD